jgi:hypothetical protein
VIAFIINLIVTIIEAGRIRRSWGKTPNIDKWVTYLIGIASFVLYLSIIYYGRYYTLQNPLEVVLDSSYFILWRGLIYDPILNVLTGRKIDYVSKTTNSIQDRIERLLGISFWTQRSICALLIILVIYLQETI